MRLPSLSDLVRIYEGSDGAATSALYANLTTLGPIGEVAVNLFRASKTSGRAKVYRGGTGRASYRDLAYGKKQWSMENLCRVLTQHAEAFGIQWGWKIDPEQSYHAWVLYADLPEVGQVSFHTAQRGRGPDYPGDWDGVKGVSPQRILRWIAGLEVLV